MIFLDWQTVFLTIFWEKVIGSSFFRPPLESRRFRSTGDRDFDRDLERDFERDFDRDLDRDLDRDFDREPDFDLDRLPPFFLTLSVLPLSSKPSKSLSAFFISSSCSKQTSPLFCPIR